MPALPSYQRLLETSRRVNWRLEDLLGEWRRLDSAELSEPPMERLPRTPTETDQRLKLCSAPDQSEVLIPHPILPPHRVRLCQSDTHRDPWSIPLVVPSSHTANPLTRALVPGAVVFGRH
jgi:hypothetical protein